MEKVVRFSKKSVKYTIAIVNWLIYSIIVGGTTTPVNDTFSNIWYFFSILLFIYTIFVSYYRNVNYKIIFLFLFHHNNIQGIPFFLLGSVAILYQYISFFCTSYFFIIFSL